MWLGANAKVCVCVISKCYMYLHNNYVPTRRELVKIKCFVEMKYANKNFSFNYWSVLCFISSVCLSAPISENMLPWLTNRDTIYIISLIIRAALLEFRSITFKLKNVLRNGWFVHIKFLGFSNIYLIIKHMEYSRHTKNHRICF